MIIAIKSSGQNNVIGIYIHHFISSMQNDTAIPTNIYIRDHANTLFIISEIKI